MIASCADCGKIFRNLCIDRSLLLKFCGSTFFGAAHKQMIQIIIIARPLEDILLDENVYILNTESNLDKAGKQDIFQRAS